MSLNSKKISKSNRKPGAGINSYPVYSKQHNELWDDVNTHENEIVTTLLVDTLKYNDADFAATAATFFSRSVTNAKPAGYSIVGGYIEVNTSFVNNGSSLALFAMLPSGSNQSSIGKHQLLQKTTNLGGYPSTLSSSGTGTSSALYVSIDNSVNVTIYFKTDVTISTGDFSAGEVKYYLILKKIL